MKIIMTETIDKVGKVGQVINVKDGFARNYLIPQKLAIMASPNNLKKIEAIEADARAKADRKNEEYRQMAHKISTLEACFDRRAEADGRLFGSVSDVDIMHYLAENEITCAKNQIVLEKAIKSIGDAEVQISFTSDINATLKVKVIDSHNVVVESEEEETPSEPLQVDVVPEAPVETPTDS